MDAVIVIDSNVWIFAEDQNSDEHEKAAKKVRDVVSTVGFGIDAIISSEVFHALSRLLGPGDAGRRVVHIVEHPAAEWLHCRMGTMAQAITLATHSNLRINDALIAQQALESKAAILTDNVRDFKKVRGLKVVALR